MEPETPSQRAARQQRSMLFRFGGAALELAGGIVAFVLIGYAIDWYFGTGRIGVVAAASLGCILGLYNLIRRAFETQREVERLNRETTEKPPEHDD